MNALVLCLDCNRHALPSEPACPFCGGALAQEPPPPMRVRVKNVTRAMIFYGAAVLAAPGCADPDPEPVPVQTSSAPQPPMQPVDLNAPMEPVQVAAAEPEGVTGEVEAEEVEEDEGVSAAERADAERRKRRQRIQANQQNRRRRQQLDVDQLRHRRLAMPYGAPPFDFDVV